MNFLAVRELTFLSLTLRILLAILLGGIIGLERGMKNRPAGLRTYMLVCLGACMVMMTNQFVYQVYRVGDPVRMGAQVISGIGFLGAGTIIITSRNQIKGLTTAAGLWACACAGLALGIGLYEVALIGSLAMFLVLTVLHELDYRMRMKTRQMDLYVELKEGRTVGEFLDVVRSKGFEPSNFVMQRDQFKGTGITAFNVTLKAPKRSDHGQMRHLLEEMDCISFIDEL